MPPKKQIIPNYKIYKYAVIRLENEEDDEERLFECIPDRWFVDENKTSCFWPPNTGKSYTVRAINCEKPEDSWNIYECRVISDGYTTYNSGFKIVQEKCNQKYNTSSADEQMNAEKYKREHPVLAMKKNDGKIEHIFAKPNTASKKQSVAKKDKNDKVSSKKIHESSTSVVLTDNRSIPSTNIEVTANSTVGMHIETETELENRHEVSVIDESSERTMNCITKKPNQISSLQSAHNLNESPSSKSSSGRSRSGGSISGGSCSGRSRSGSVSIASRSGRSISNKNRSNSSLSGGSRARRSCSGSRSRGSRSGSRSRGSRSGSRSRGSRSKSCSRSRAGGSRSGWLSDASRSGRSLSRNSRSHSSLSVAARAGRSAGQRRGRSRSKTNRSHSSRSNLSMLNHSKSRPDQSSRSSSESSRSRSGSRSRARNDNHHHRTRKVSSDRKKKRHRSSERERQAKRLRIGNHPKSRPAIVEPQSSSEQSGPSSRKNSYKKTTYRPKLKPVREVHSRTKKNLTAPVHDLTGLLQKMSATIEQTNQQLRENDRRLHRMEMTVNKIFVMVGDLNENGEVQQDELLNEQGFEIPQLPIESTNELTVIKRKLRNKEFKAFFLQHEKGYCRPTKRSTDTSTISKYLMRFISLRVRSKLTLKENGEDGPTLFKDFHQVYLFLIDTMIAGYKCAKRTIAFDDAHTALRIVWGRSKQQYRASKLNRKSNPKQKRLSK